MGKGRNKKGRDKKGTKKKEKGEWVKIRKGLSDKEEILGNTKKKRET